MPIMGIYDHMKRAFQETVGPDVHAPRREIQRLDGRITDAETKISRVEGKIARLDATIGAADAELTGLRTELVSLKGVLLAEIRRLDARIDGVACELRTASDIHERLAALEARQRP